MNYLQYQVNFDALSELQLSIFNTGFKLKQKRVKVFYFIKFFFISQLSSDSAGDKPINGCSSLPSKFYKDLPIFMAPQIKA